jgi:hypothetical protein
MPVEKIEDIYDEQTALALKQVGASVECQVGGNWLTGYTYKISVWTFGRYRAGYEATQSDRDAVLHTIELLLLSEGKE